VSDLKYLTQITVATIGREGNLQVTGDSTKDSVEQTIESRVQAQKKLVEELKVQWKQLWSERLNDKVCAEDISNSNYDSLHIERGTIIHASRDYKPLNFKEILEQHKVDNPENFIQPDVNMGGWTKFVKTEINPQKTQKSKRQSEHLPEKKLSQQPKKGGRGWLHKT
jgi:hypothetical protein